MSSQPPAFNFQPSTFNTPTHPLVPLLETWLPAKTERALLRACCDPGPAGAAALRSWRKAVDDPVAALRENERGAKALLPLLARYRRGNELGPDLAPKAKLAALREELRTRAIRRETGQALDALDQVGITVILAGGLALAATVYPSIESRHCHDVDLLVDAADLDRAVETLARAGFQPGEARRLFRRLNLPTGFGLALAGNAFRSSARPVATGAVPVHSRELDGRVRRVPEIDWLLLARIEHVWPSLRSAPLLALADCFHLVRSADLDWARLIVLARDHRLSVQLATILRYLPRIGAEIPADSLAEANESALRSSATEIDLALSGFRPDPFATLNRALQRPSLWPAALPVIRHLAAPVPASIDRAQHPSLARYYLGRPLRYLRSRATWSRDAGPLPHFRLPPSAFRPPSWRPSPAETLLLKAAVLEGEGAREAWAAWRTTGAIGSASPGSQQIFPLVYKRLTAMGLDDPQLRALKPLTLRTWVQNERNLRTGAEAIRLLEDAGIPTLVLKGAAMLTRYYRDTAARIVGDVDVLVPTDRRDAAIAVLQDVGWRFMYRAPVSLLNMRHSYGMARGPGESFDLHWHALYASMGARNNQEFWNHAEPMTLMGVPTSTLSPTDHLLHLATHGIHSLWFGHGANIRWATDMMAVLRCPGTVIDWDRLVREAEIRRLVLPIRESLSFLHDELSASIPDRVLERLQQLPLSRIEHYEQRGWRDEQGVSGRLLRHWLRYSRSNPDTPNWRRPFQFPVYLGAMWQVDRVWQVPYRAAWYVAHLTLGRRIEGEWHSPIPRPPGPV